MNKLLYDYLVKNNVKLEDINKFANKNIYEMDGKLLGIFKKQ